MAKFDKLAKLKSRVAEMGGDALKARHSMLVKRVEMDQREIDLMVKEMKRREK